MAIGRYLEREREQRYLDIRKKETMRHRDGDFRHREKNENYRDKLKDRDCDLLRDGEDREIIDRKILRETRKERKQTEIYSFH